MWLYSPLDYLKSGSARGRNQQPCTRRWQRGSAGHKLSLEHLEGRSLFSVGPLPIPGGAFLPNPFGGPDIHYQFPGPADSTVPGMGGEPSTITDFNGFIGVAGITGTGTDNNGNTLLYLLDLRFMKGAYQGVDGKSHHGTFAFL